MKKFFIYGTGRVGINLAQALLNIHVKENIEIVFYVHHDPEKYHGLLMDIEDTMSMNGNVSYQFTLSNDVADMKSANAVFLCAGKSPTPEEYEEAAAKGIDDRML